MKNIHNLFLAVLVIGISISGCKKSDNPDPDGGGGGNGSNIVTLNGANIEIKEAAYAALGQEGGVGNYSHSIFLYSETGMSGIMLTIYLITPGPSVNTGDYPSLAVNPAPVKNNQIDFESYVKSGELNESISQFAIGGSLMVMDETIAEQYDLEVNTLYIIANLVLKMNGFSDDKIDFSASGDLTNINGVKYMDFSVKYKDGYTNVTVNNQ